MLLRIFVNRGGLNFAFYAESIINENINQSGNIELCHLVFAIQAQLKLSVEALCEFSVTGHTRFRTESRHLHRSFD